MQLHLKETLGIFIALFISFLVTFLILGYFIYPFVPDPQGITAFFIERAFLLSFLSALAVTLSSVHLIATAGLWVILLAYQYTTEVVIPGPGSMNGFFFSLMLVCGTLVYAAFVLLTRFLIKKLLVSPLGKISYTNTIIFGSVLAIILVFILASLNSDGNFKSFKNLQREEYTNSHTVPAAVPQL